MTTRKKSVSKKREDRRENDAYETPKALCAAVVERLSLKGLKPSRILEPGAGSGNFVEAARKQWPDSQIVAVEIRETYTPHIHEKSCYELRRVEDGEAEVKVLICKPDYFAITPKLQEAGANRVFIVDYLSGDEGTFAPFMEPFDLAVGNPPYGGGLGEAFVARAISQLNPKGVLAFVLKMHFFGTRKRVEMWRKYPYFCAWPITPRPDFTGDGRDTSEYALITWARDDRGKLRDTQMLCADSPIEWRERKSDNG